MDGIYFIQLETHADNGIFLVRLVLDVGGGYERAVRQQFQPGVSAVPFATVLMEQVDTILTFTAAHDVVVNLQGDFPTIEPEVIRAAVAPLSADVGADIGTLVNEITGETELVDPNKVKAAVAFAPGSRIGRALYFSRLVVPGGEGPHYHHIGIYAFRREALARFVALPKGQLEARESLEQLRALEDGMRIDVALVDSFPMGVDTPADLARARAILVPGS